MKRVLSLIILLLSGAQFAAAGTAYEALRTLSAREGEGILNRVVEVAGDGGAPQPAVWQIVTADPLARGGIRVYEVRAGRITAERTPVARQAGDPVVMDFNRLNLDSTGAFEVAEKEALRAQIGFDSLNYVLHAGDRDRTPVWALQLLDAAGRPVGYYEIAADTGAVFAGGRASGAPAPRNQAPPREDYHVGQEDDSRYRGDSEGGDFADKLRRFGNRVERHFRRDGAAVEEFFTGRNTVGPEED